jgi:hypothetical protein
MVLVCELSNVYTIYNIVLLAVGIQRNPDKTVVTSTVLRNRVLVEVVGG